LFAYFTTWLKIGDVFPARLAFPEYTAVIECVSAPFKVDVLNVALPVELLTSALPSTVPKFLNVTVPFTNPPKAGTTVAVKVTNFPKFEGFGDDASVTLVPALFMTFINTPEVLGPSLTLPLYVAMI
jgi:hypothetical protein